VQRGEVVLLLGARADRLRHHFPDTPFHSATVGELTYWHLGAAMEGLLTSIATSVLLRTSYFVLRTPDSGLTTSGRCCPQSGRPQSAAVTPSSSPQRIHAGGAD